MILQALKEYYDRKASDPDSGIAPAGWEIKELPFIIVIDGEGNLVNLEDTREKKDKKLIAKSFLVPKGVKRSSGVASNLLWDNVEYALGIVCKSKEPRVKEQHSAFLERLMPYSSVPSVAAVLKFLQSPGIDEALNNYHSWADAKKECAFLSFRLVDSDSPVFRDEALMPLLKQTEPCDNVKKNRCLVTGDFTETAKLHTSIKGVKNTNTTGGNIVSFNFDAANSFRKKQGDNAPVGKEAEFAYSTALNTLLAKNSDQKMFLGESTIVFWAGKADKMESDFGFFFSEKDDPDDRTERIKSFYSSLSDGKFITEDDNNMFYVLGLAPNAARISIRFWQTGTVAEIAARIRQYFDDLQIVHDEKFPDYPSLWRLLLSTAAQGKSENIIPNLEGDFLRSILEGAPFPETLFQQVMLRNKRERSVTYHRAQLIKAFINRKLRISNPNNERSLSMSLDKENLNIAYRLGRLFAVLEKIQMEANPGINATIRDRFYASASATPGTVFAILMRLKNHHLAKIEHQGRRIYFENLLGEILEPVKAFPSHLSLNDQGIFAIGYYHQNRDFFTKHNNDNN